MSNVRRSKILNPHSRFKRIEEAFQLPVSIPERPLPASGLISSVVTTSQSLFKTISSNFLRFLFPKIEPNLDFSARASENSAQANDFISKSQTIPEKISESLVLPMKNQNSSNGNEITKRRKKFECTDCGIQTDLPYKPIISNEINSQKNRPINRKTIESSGEMETRGTDEEDDFTSKNSRKKIIVKKISRNNKNTIEKGPNLDIIPEVSERKNKADKKDKGGVLENKEIYNQMEVNKNFEPLTEEKGKSNVFGNIGQDLQRPKEGSGLFPNSPVTGGLFPFSSQVLSSNPGSNFGTPKFEDKALNNSPMFSLDPKKKDLEFTPNFSTHSLFPNRLSTKEDGLTDKKNIFAVPNSNPAQIDPKNVENSLISPEIFITPVKPDEKKSSQDPPINVSAPLNKAEEAKKPFEVVESPNLKANELPKDETKPVINIPETKPVPITKDFSNNPFLNTAAAKTIGIPYKFGPTESSPGHSVAPLQSISQKPLPESVPIFSGTVQPAPDVPQSADIDMFNSSPAPTLSNPQPFMSAFSPSPSSVQSSSTLFSPSFSNSPTIPSNLNQFTPKPDIFNPTVVPHFSQPHAPLFTPPSAFNPQNSFLNAPSLFGNANINALNPPQNKGFTLGLVSSSNKRQRK